MPPWRSSATPSPAPVRVISPAGPRRSCAVTGISIPPKIKAYATPIACERPPPSQRRLFGRRLFGSQPARLVHLRAGLRQTLVKAREPGQRGGHGEPEKAGAAHAEFGRAPVDPADQAFRQVDVHPLRGIRRIHTDNEISEEVAAFG